MELGHFQTAKATIDAAFYVESVHNRFEALLKFALPDAPDRFKQLITTLERRPARTLSVASYFGAAAVHESEIASAANRNYLDRTSEASFWKSMLKEDMATPKAGPFSEKWRVPQTITVSKTKHFQPTRTIAETALLHAYTRQESIPRLVELALRLKPTATPDPDVSAALDAIRKTDEYQSAVRAKETAEAEVRAATIESKKRKLLDNSTAIAAQPRRGAVNEVPVKQKDRSAEL